MDQHAYHASRHELLVWINSQLPPSIELSKVEQCATALPYLSICARTLFPNSAQMIKSKMRASIKSELDNLSNFRLLNDVLDANSVRRPVFDADKLATGKFQLNLEFLQWFAKFAQSNLNKSNNNNATTTLATTERNGESNNMNANESSVQRDYHSPLPSKSHQHQQSSVGAATAKVNTMRSQSLLSSNNNNNNNNTASTAKNSSSHHHQSNNYHLFNNGSLPRSDDAPSTPRSNAFLNPPTQNKSNATRPKLLNSSVTPVGTKSTPKRPAILNSPSPATTKNGPNNFQNHIEGDDQQIKSNEQLDQQERANDAEEQEEEEEAGKIKLVLATNTKSKSHVDPLARIGAIAREAASKSKSPEPAIATNNNNNSVVMEEKQIPIKPPLLQGSIASSLNPEKENNNNNNKISTEKTGSQLPLPSSPRSALNTSGNEKLDDEKQETNRINRPVDSLEEFNLDLDDEVDDDDDNEFQDDEDSPIPVNSAVETSKSLLPNHKKKKLLASINAQRKRSTSPKSPSPTVVKKSTNNFNKKNSNHAVNSSLNSSSTSIVNNNNNNNNNLVTPSKNHSENTAIENSSSRRAQALARVNERQKQQYASYQQQQREKEIRREEEKREKQEKQDKIESKKATAKNNNTSNSSLVRSRTANVVSPRNLQESFLPSQKQQQRVAISVPNNRNIEQNENNNNDDDEEDDRGKQNGENISPSLLTRNNADLELLILLQLQNDKLVRAEIERDYYFEKLGEMEKKILLSMEEASTNNGMNNFTELLKGLKEILYKP